MSSSAPPDDRLCLKSILINNFYAISEQLMTLIEKKSVNSGISSIPLIKMSSLTNDNFKKNVKKTENTFNQMNVLFSPVKLAAT